MTKLYYAALTCLVAGLASGFFYREFTKANDFTGDSQLSLVHTHLLALGMLFFLLVLALEKLFDLSSTGLLTPFFWVYSAGLAVTVSTMIANGVITVTGGTSSPAIAGISGLGHILITTALGILFVALGRQVRAHAREALSSERAPRSS
ncbi:hypothetical protein RCH16_000424 [Cryobacterium sp. MP_M5]|uniref:DUF2871 domain-containing protein n=1 Tax=unclassified Cryobacterium TaxID=2649013 RepID=UPI0018CAC145|nr:MULTISPECIES: DUF2871 domain-containing protein [unclassified Cryobacterium]MBG6057232.1 hypothetical protein [Cryobacterium sp. MP_M3]MEC5175431.1 hypothetical protein [Cryobacterium sp. MP_M5]